MFSDNCKLYSFLFMHCSLKVHQTQLPWTVSRISMFHELCHFMFMNHSWTVHAHFIYFIWSNLEKYCVPDTRYGWLIIYWPTEELLCCIIMTTPSRDWSLRTILLYLYIGRLGIKLVRGCCTLLAINTIYT